MAKAKKKEALSLEEKLEQALVTAEEQPFDVPDNWCWSRLKILVDIKTGKKDANYGSEDGEYYFFTCATEPIRCQGYSFEGKAILLAGNGDIGNISIYDGKFEAYQRTYVLQKCTGVLEEYLYYYFKYRWVDYNKDKMYGTAIPYIRLGNLQEYEVPLPPLVEQQRIVEQIKSLFMTLESVEEKLEEVINKVDVQRETIIKRAYTGELTKCWRNENNYSYSEWKTEEVSEKFDVTGGLQKKPDRAPKDNPIPYVTVANVFRDRLDLSEIKYFEVFDGELEKLRLKSKDILVVEGNGSGGEIGRCALWNDEIPVCIHQNHIIRMRRKQDNVVPEYVLYYLNSDEGKKIMKERAKTTAGLYNLSTGKIRTIPIPFAPYEEQKEIVQVLDSLKNQNKQTFECIYAVQDRVQLLKKAILAKAFRGELGTNNPDEESAVELLKRVLK